jgi:uncharacterized membrane protein
MDIKHIIELIGVGFDIAGVMVLVIGTLFAFTAYTSSLLRPSRAQTRYHALRQNVGKAILLGLELLVAADIVRTVAINPTFVTVGVLGLIVLVRTFLSWSLEVEIKGAWPWSHSHLQQPASPHSDQL